MSELNAMSSLQSQNPTSSYKVYKRRFYILFLWSVLAFSVGYLFTNLGPIYNSLKTIFNWSPFQIALYPFYATCIIGFLSMPFAYLLEKFGLRKMVLLFSAAISLSCISRCFDFSDTLNTFLLNFSGICIGIGGIGISFVPVTISAQFFPPNQRKTSTAVGTMSNLLGIAACFVIGPLFVNENETPERMKSQYYLYTYIQTGYTVATFVAILLYFPDKPPSPPSASALTERVQLLEGTKKLVKSAYFWVISMPMTLVVGMYGGWISILSLNLSAEDVSEKTAGYIGFWSILASVVFAVLIGKLADKCGNLKAIQLACCCLAAEGAVWLVLILGGILQFSVRQAYFSVILIVIGSSALVAVGFEFAVDCLYPIDEAVVVGLMGSLANIVSGVFLAILFVVDASQISLINWVYAGATVLALPFALAVRERKSRQNVDEKVRNEDENDVVFVERF